MSYYRINLNDEPEENFEVDDILDDQDGEDEGSSDDSSSWDQFRSGNGYFYGNSDDEEMISEALANGCYGRDDDDEEMIYDPRKDERVPMSEYLAEDEDPGDFDGEIDY